MRIETCSNELAAAGAVADLIAEALRDQPALVLGLPTGRTMIVLYRELARRCARGAVDFAGATTFNLDEFWGIRPDHPGSFRAFMEHHCFSQVSVDPARVNFLNGAAPDAEAECDRYERAIEKAGGIGLQILGIGTNGHIGFNEPGRWLSPRTHCVTLRPETRRANAGLFGGVITRVPRKALSMGMATILGARSIILLATGSRKAGCVKRMLCGPLTTRLPASFLQVHPDVTVVLDHGAAAGLAAKEARRRTGQRDPGTGSG